MIRIAQTVCIHQSVRFFRFYFSGDGNFLNEDLKEMTVNINLLMLFLIQLKH